MKKLFTYIAIATLFLAPACAIVNAQVSTGTADTAGTAAPAAGTPTLAVQGFVSNVRLYAYENAAGLTAEERCERLEVKEKLSAVLDLHEMARLILARHWDKLKPAEREKYAGLLTKLVEKIGYPQIEKFFNEKLDILYEGEKPLDYGAAAVSTKIVYKEEDVTFSTEFRLHPTNKGWRIHDVITDGESLLLIYRNQHAGIIKDKGFPHLIKLMEKKLNETK